MSLEPQQLQELLHQLVTDTYTPVDAQTIGDETGGDETTASIVRSLNTLHNQKQTLVRHYNEDIKKGEARLRQIIETTPVGICITNEEGLFEYVNPTYCRLYGYEPEELIGNEFIMVVPPENQDQMRHLHTEFMGRRYELRGEWSVVRKDGSTMTIIADAAYIIDVDGRPKKVTFVLDISARKQAEEALKETVDKLNTEIDERIRLEKTKAQVEQIIRHDLRNPLNGIIAAADLLLVDSATDEQRELYLLIRESGKKLDSMLSNSMDFVRMEEGTYQLQARALNLAALLRSVDLEVSKLAKAHQVRVHYYLGDSPLDWGTEIPISGEKIHLEDMLANLLRNAIEASSPEDVVSVKVRPGPPTCTIEVHNLQPVPAEIRDTFFERYATSGKRLGTGLGTYVARLITEAHGGSITFSSSEDAGTTVTVELPALSSDPS